MTAAAVVALRPESLADLWMVRKWLHHWRDVGEPYHFFHGEIDYPPSAFLVLWPLGVPPDSVIRILIIPIGILTMGSAAYFLARWLSERLYLSLTTPQLLALSALMLAGGGSRGTIWRGQTAGLAVLFGALALYWCRRRPVAAACALALAAFKPHLAVGFALAILMTERRDVVAWAGALVAGMTVLFAASTGVPVSDVIDRYIASLLAIYNGPDRIVGLLSMRWVIEYWVGDYQLSTTLWLVAAIVSLLLIGFAAHRHHRAKDQTMVAAACLLWPLLFLPHQLYHSALAAPAVWMMMWPESTMIRREGMRIAIVSAFVMFGVIDIPRLVRLLTPEGGELWMASYVWSPVRMAMLFVLVLYALVRQPRNADALAATAVLNCDDPRSHPRRR